MVTVYSSALIFDPWNEIAECKDSPALLYLSHGGRGELIGAPAGWCSGTKPTRCRGLGGAQFVTDPQKELCAIWPRTAQNSSVRHRCLAADSWPPPCLSASETKSYYAERIALERKKKGGGGEQFLQGFLCGFFYIFKSHWEPHYNLVISGGGTK